MNMIYHHIARLLFALALGMLGVAIIEFLANLMDYTVLRGILSPGRMIEMSAALLLFVVADLLRQIRDGLGSKSGS